MTFIAAMSGVAVGAVAATLAYLISRKDQSASFLQRLHKHKWDILPIFLAIVVIVFGTFSAIYSNVNHELRTAETNVYSYAREASVACGIQAEAYEKSATKWLTWAEALRDKGQKRARTVLWSGLALASTVLLLPFMLTGRACWMLTLAMPVVLLVLSVGAYALQWRVPCDDWLFHSQSLDMKLNLDRDLHELMKKEGYSWLKDHLEKVQKCLDTSGVYIQEKGKCWDPRARDFYDLEKEQTPPPEPLP